MCKEGKEHAIGESYINCRNFVDLKQNKHGKWMETVPN